MWWPLLLSTTVHVSPTRARTCMHAATYGVVVVCAGKFCHELQSLLRPGTAIFTSVYAGTEGIYGACAHTTKLVSVSWGAHLLPRAACCTEHLCALGLDS